MAVALKVMVAGEFGALLTIEMFPESVPAVDGANSAVKDVLAPALIVWEPSPLMLNPVPEAVADEIVSAAFPEFVTVMLFDALLPTFTLPKTSLVALRVSPGCV